MTGSLASVTRLARTAPDRVLIDAPAEGRVVRAAALAEDARVMAAALRGQGVSPDHLVLSLVGNRTGFFPLLLACLEIGSALMPIDRGTPLAEVHQLARRFGGTVLVLPADLATGPAAVRLPHDLALQHLEDVEPQPWRYRGAALLKLTSGSTGLPKATFTTAAQIEADGRAIIEAMDIRPDDWQLGFIPLSHSYGLGNLVMPLLLQGTPLVLREAFVPAHVRADAERVGARVFAGVPFMYEHLLTHLPDDGWPASLETLISAGAPLAADTHAQFHARFGRAIHSFYGASEAGGIAYDDSPRAGEPAVGRPMPGVTVTLRPEEGITAGGRIHVAGPAVSRGYAGNEEADAFIDGGFLTGDLGRFDADGRLHLEGRVSGFINVAGRKVQPDEVERVLRTMPLVADVRVMGAPDERRGEQLVACIVPRGDLHALAIRQFCAERLAPHKIPRQFVFVDAIPVDERGKTNRRALGTLVERHLKGEPV
ncbi:MAG TPA: class I adenylate-forming enzyme family protein [Vicinamibacterales bacterium]